MLLHQVGLDGIVSGGFRWLPDNDSESFHANVVACCFKVCKQFIINALVWRCCCSDVCLLMQCFKPCTMVSSSVLKILCSPKPGSGQM